MASFCFQVGLNPFGVYSRAASWLASRGPRRLSTAAGGPLQGPAVRRVPPGGTAAASAPATRAAAAACRVAAAAGRAAGRVQRAAEGVAAVPGGRRGGGGGGGRAPGGREEGEGAGGEEGAGGGALGDLLKGIELVTNAWNIVGRCEGKAWKANATA